MKAGLTALVLLALLPGCADLQGVGAGAAERRRELNDAQARATKAALCDISIGAYWRELNAPERALVDVVCGAPLGLPAIGRVPAPVPPALLAPGLPPARPGPAGAAA